MVACLPHAAGWHSLRALHRLALELPLNPLGPPAFVFDIDGVLIRGKCVLDSAKTAMAELCPSGTWRFPTVFMTNGGGVTEAHKAQQLSSWLQVPVAEEQELGQRPVLVAGRGNVLQVAAGYGFTRLVSSEQLAAAMPTAVPFLPPLPAPLPGSCPVRDLGLGTEAAPIEAVLVMSDPSNWYVDLQLITDVLASGGVPGRPESQDPASPPCRLCFSNPDLLWANAFPRNRFGQVGGSSSIHP
ncbi:uncharacterized protein HaLaN_00608 [Haematococcus lacustris]|uniref:Uncharacterized protein n=1 Tax=Haematococcus lacustris TaxID=44745 RepID=A0A699YGH4_HAELA|nr:uncharacterized protein HaLaN_00608 [Haematococcus lacustris]